jgi:hypothetical protein
MNSQVCPPEAVSDQTTNHPAFNQKRRRLDGLKSRAQVMDRRTGTRIDQGKVDPETMANGKQKS